MKKKQTLAKAVRSLGGIQLLHRYWGAHRLTVLAYHRILDFQRDQFDEYEPNISASLGLFAQQMEVVAKYFNVISIETLDATLRGERSLPKHPLLITFDDGYLDNFQHAFPILKQYGFPATIFLMTDGMDKQQLPWWDEVAFYFHHTSRKSAELPLIGQVNLSEKPLRLTARERLLSAMKLVSDAQKLEALSQLSALLEVEAPQRKQVFLTWDQVRELVSNGIACQNHTVSHPILTRISTEEVQNQLEKAKQRIEDETKQPVFAFAIPNGMPSDYDLERLRILEKTGHRLAFTLSSGPMLAKDIPKFPLQIPRVYMDYKDNIDLSLIKMMGLPALTDHPPYLG